MLKFNNGIANWQSVTATAATARTRNGNEFFTLYMITEVTNVIVDNTFFTFGGRTYRQQIGIPIGRDCAGYFSLYECLQASVSLSGQLLLLAHLPTDLAAQIHPHNNWQLGESSQLSQSQCATSTMYTPRTIHTYNTPYIDTSQTHLGFHGDYFHGVVPTLPPPPTSCMK